MSYTTVEVELDHGRVWSRGSATLPTIEEIRALGRVLA